MSKFFALKPNEVKKLLKEAKPVVTIFSAISSLQKKIAEKEKNIKSKKAVSEEVKKLKTELKEKEQELEKLGKKKVIEGGKALRVLLDCNKNFVKYLAKGYSYFGGKIDPEELTSEGISSLPKAIEKYDMNSGSTLQTYSGF
jgi:DNA-directed RNA polymerase sigma subunit (sigma70/sigma32)